jgi:hypothetical protein
MGWENWDNPQYAGYRETRSVAGFIVSERSVTDRDIDRELAHGRNPRSSFGRKISRMPKGDQKKVERRIKAREDKRAQGKK